MFLPAVLIPACASSYPFHMMYSASKLNKQSDNIQLGRTPFLIWNQSVVPCAVLMFLLDLHTVSQEVGQVWYSHIFKNFSQFVVIHTVKGFGVLSKAKVNDFLGLSCFFDDQRMLAV